MNLKKFEKYIGVAGSTLSLLGLGYNLWKSFSRKDLNPHKVYSVSEVSNILGIVQEETMNLIYAGKLSAQQIGGKYRILGSNIEIFLRQ